MFRMLTITAALTFSGSALAVELVPPTTLGTSFFNSMPITTTDAKGRTSQISFTPGGTLTRTTATGRTSEGTWRLSEDGFCMQVGNAKRESCYVVLKRDDGKIATIRRSGEPFIWEK
jgi:hypothetical protein